ncbi:MAG: CCA tRNA nucleotidyltransferase [Phascolarctobacterium sp.]
MDEVQLVAKLPAYTKSILQALNDAGYEAYVVGGAVRDLLLGREPGDYDITTNARPEQVLALCQAKGWHTVDQLGHNFGCVLIVLEGEPTEVTTFRGERYDDGDAHRPAATWFCDTLQEDLSRRDFTINALALDIHGHVFDYHGGLQDLRRRILRPVGKAQVRYGEDALRMLRACRFVAQLGFDYVQDGVPAPACGMACTPYYLKEVPVFPVERCGGLSLERVRTELEKLLVSEHAGKGLMLMLATGLLQQSCRIRQDGADLEVPILPEAAHLLGLPQNPRFHIYDTWEHTLLAIDNSPRELAIRWALVLHDLGKGLSNVRIIKPDGQPSDPDHEAQSAIMAEAILQRLRYPADFVRLVVWLVAQHMRFAPMLLTGEKTLRRWLRHEALNGPFRTQAQLVAGYKLLTEVFLADMGATHARENQQLMTEGRSLGDQVIAMAQSSMPIATQDLAVNGRELLELVSKNNIKETFAYLINRVQSGNLPNEHDALLAALKKKLARQERRSEQGNTAVVKA